MIRTLHTRASVDEHVSLGIKMYFEGTLPDAVIDLLKIQKYLVHGKYYNAANVATVVNTLMRANAGILSGALKSTKAKGLQLNTKETT